MCHLGISDLAVFRHSQTDHRNRPADTKMPNAFPLKIKDENLSRVINASSFCKHFDIKVTRTVEFNNAVTDASGDLKSKELR